MKYRLIAFVTLLLSAVSLVSCIDPDQTEEAILQENIEAIEKYLLDNPTLTASVKNYKEEQEGIYMFWQVASGLEINRILPLDTVVVNYTGKFLNNTVFDTSIERVAREKGIYSNSRNYTPLRFPLGTGRGAIIGFEFGVSLMKIGEKATIIFPARLGYGSQGSDGIPPRSPLVFELELLDIKKGPNHTKP